MRKIRIIVKETFMKCKTCGHDMKKEKRGDNNYVYVCTNCGKVAGKDNRK